MHLHTQGAIYSGGGIKSANVYHITHQMEKRNIGKLALIENMKCSSTRACSG